jgi:ubiquinone/menaquinone biosynthesis C-methylase UbiE/uncharacterized protein YbaR (Trm112 family)
VLSEKFLNRLHCIKCSGDLVVQDEDKLFCKSCSSLYSAKSDIPRLIEGIPADDQEWNEWNSEEILRTGESYVKRATGELPEKEASKSYCNLITKKTLYKSGDSLLDIGSACGHFYRSFHDRLDNNIDYTGIDATYKFLEWGKEIYHDHGNIDFVNGDALKLPFKNSSFDTVIANLYHFFPELDVPLSEAIRVARKRILWRTPIGDYNYTIKMISDNDYDNIGVIKPNRDDYSHTLVMMYTEAYLQGLVNSLGAEIEFIEKDSDFSDFDNNALSDFSMTSTRSINGIQTHGNLILNWHYVSILPDRSNKSLKQE